MTGNDEQGRPKAATSDVDELAIDTIRTLAVDAVQAANSGHPGTPMGLAPLGYVLYSSVLRHNPANPQWFNRDRFVLSGGHASMLQYALLHLSGYDLPLEELRNFRQWGSLCPGHPEYGLTPGIEVSTGPLGQGIGNAVGFAIAEQHLAERFNRADEQVVDWRTFFSCGDGDMQEGIASEAASLAGNLGLGKLIGVYDSNRIQIEGSTDIAFHEQVAERYDAYGWDVISLELDVTIEGIKLALEQAAGRADKPSLIVLRTHIGYGSPHKQDTAAAHGAPLGPDEVRLTKENLGWPTEETFYVPDAVRELFAEVKAKGARAEAEWSERYERWASEHPQLAEELERLQPHAESPALASTPTPSFDPATEKPVATRKASGRALNWLAPLVPELVGGSADLAPSTETYLDGEGDILRHDLRGRNLHFGVREHGMGAIVNAMTIAGLRAYGATFFVFSDYMRGALRLAALMRIPSTFVFTHDSIGVGEDGPTHQPIEHLASLRAMPGLTTLRPADLNETYRAWRHAATSTDRPTLLVLTRQNLPVLDPAKIPDDAIARGAYVYDDPEDAQLILIGTGSEVSLCIDAAAILKDEHGIAARVVSMPSYDRFAAQPAEYRDRVLPPELKARVAVEMASPFGWDRWVGDDGIVIGLDHFGASAPFAELRERFGFTPEQVAQRAAALLAARATTPA